MPTVRYPWEFITAIACSGAWSFWHSYSCFPVRTHFLEWEPILHYLVIDFVSVATLPLWYLMAMMLVLLRVPVMNSPAILRDEVCIRGRW